MPSNMTFLLQAAHITKRFPGTTALDNAQFELQRGEIHALVGENGAGKSTLMKILSGVYVADAGEIRFEDRRIEPTNPRHALALGIAIVHQELSVVRALTVAENIFPGRLPTNALGMVKYRQLFDDAARVLENLQVDIDPRTPMERLSVANQQLVEIAKALSLNCKVLILDEPTSALTEREADILFGLLRRLAASTLSLTAISRNNPAALRSSGRYPKPNRIACPGSPIWIGVPLRRISPISWGSAPKIARASSERPEPINPAKPNTSPAYSLKLLDTD
ncbi:MAG TPA: ATP-binding cassette domain-containing protein [Phototrophicaceae bacterium]|nr:ATP-binding cassette domain-containing protein [Phototrophicaceae bacterium]